MEYSELQELLFKPTRFVKCQLVFLISQEGKFRHDFDVL